MFKTSNHKGQKLETFTFILLKDYKNLKKGQEINGVVDKTQKGYQVYPGTMRVQENDFFIHETEKELEKILKLKE